MNNFFNKKEGNKRNSMCRVISQEGDEVTLKEMFFGNTGIVKAAPLKKYEVGTLVKVFVDPESFNPSSWIE